MSVTHRLPGRPAWLLVAMACSLMLTLPVAVAHAQQAPQGSATQAYEFSIPAQNLRSALIEFWRQSGQELLYSDTDVAGKTSNPVNGRLDRDTALTMLLAGSGLEFEATPSGGLMIADRATLDAQKAQAGANALPSETAAPVAAGEAGAADSDPGMKAPGEQTTANVEVSRQGGIEEIIVTGQKKEERIQDVPIAISAFSMDDLEAQKIEGGFDLLKAIPNVTFTKTNFTSYNFQIRGIGTQAISATSDPGVAVSFNGTGLIHNRLFEQEYLDIERVEVLRGPQGTLYGRNATAGVVNVISAVPKLSAFEGSLKAEVGNYNTRRGTAIINIPVVQDVLGLRLAGAFTDREGYDYNTITNKPINGRDLYSTRLTLRFTPDERLTADLIWERFVEDDDRLRTGKQLCHSDPGPEQIGTAGLDSAFRRATFSQGCKPGSLYAAEAFGTPNGFSLPYVLAAQESGLGLNIGVDEDNRTVGVLRPGIDPYGGLMQSRNLREIASVRDPIYRAEADLFQLNVSFDLTPELQIVSQTAWNEDSVFSFQDYNRFNSVPVFTDSSRLRRANSTLPTRFVNFSPGGIFCDPQVGCTDRLAGMDISQADSEQFSQEFRMQSAFEGPVNFSIGANYTKFETLNDYYVMINVLTALAQSEPFTGPNDNWPDGNWVPGFCNATPYLVQNGIFIPSDESACPYVDPNPVNSSRNFQGEGHNYFRSKNPYSLRSWAMFGELYVNLRDDLKLTAGLRYTDDRKTFTPVPSQLLLAPQLWAGGSTVSKGYPANPDIEQHWGEWTGRLVLDWKPEPIFGWQDDTLLYASVARGYKGGGANPPTPGFATGDAYIDAAIAAGLNPFTVSFYQSSNFFPIAELTGVDYGPTFEPEFVNALEVGMKNTLFGNALGLNLTAFYYDYADYQVSQIKDRTAVNENFDARIWGVELEALFSPTPSLQIVGNLGYLRTRIADGETSIDIMNRTQGDPNYVLAKPWLTQPSNCVVPLHVAEYWANNPTSYHVICGGVGGPIVQAFGRSVPDPMFNGAPYDYRNYPELNGGAGLRAELSGNELPNAPRWTANLGAQYTWDLFGGEWSTTLRGDAYWQSQSYWRVYNLEPFDRLKSWYNFNVGLKLERPAEGLAIELYMKNVLDDTPLTGAFLNSDDSGLTTNVFALDPRLVGFSIRKSF